MSIHPYYPYYGWQCPACRCWVTGDHACFVPPSSPVFVFPRNVSTPVKVYVVRADSGEGEYVVGVYSTRQAAEAVASKRGWSWVDEGDLDTEWL